jgi:hypothetical protein
MIFFSLRLAKVGFQQAIITDLPTRIHRQKLEMEMDITFNLRKPRLVQMRLKFEKKT